MRARNAVLTLLVISILLPAATLAAQGTPANTSEGSTVRLDNQPLFEIQWGYGNFSAQYRASTIAKKLKRIADDYSIKPEITLQPNELSIDLMCGDVLLGSVFSADAKAAGITREELAKRWQSALQQGIIDYRVRYGRERRILRGVAALLAIGLFAVVWLGLRRGTRALTTRTVAHLQNKVRQTRKQVLALIPNSQIDKAVPRFFELLRMAVSLALLIGLFQLLLWIYPPTRAVAANFVGAVGTPIKGLLAKFWGNAPNLFVVFVIGFFTLSAVRFVRFFFHKIGDGTLIFPRFKARWAETTQHLVSILIVICALLVAYPYIPGSESPAFKGITLFIGVLASIGSAGVVPNMISGIMLTYMDAFEVGDVVRIGETHGTVHDTGILSTTLRSRATELITIPNSTIWGSCITNFTRRVGDGSTVVAKVGIGYDAPWRKVEAILKTAAARTPGSRSSPEPYVLAWSLEQFSVMYELHVFLATGAPVYEVKSELHKNILDACNEFGVQIMTPSYEGDPERAKIIPKDQWFTAPVIAMHKPQATPDGDEQSQRKAAS